MRPNPDRVRPDGEKEASEQPPRRGAGCGDIIDIDGDRVITAGLGSKGDRVGLQDQNLLSRQRDCGHILAHSRSNQEGIGVADSLEELLQQVIRQLPGRQRGMAPEDLLQLAQVCHREVRADAGMGCAAICQISGESPGTAARLDIENEIADDQKLGYGNAQPFGCRQDSRRARLGAERVVAGEDHRKVGRGDAVKIFECGRDGGVTVAADNAGLQALHMQPINEVFGSPVGARLPCGCRFHAVEDPECFGSLGWR